MSKELSIIEESEKLFTQNTINNTSIDDIAKACKMSKATFYKYFKNKESIVLAILKKYKVSLADKCQNIDSNFDIESIDKLKEKIKVIWEYTYKSCNFYCCVSGVFNKSTKDLNELKRIYREQVIKEYQKSLLMTYGYKIKYIMWDIIFVIDGLIHEFITLSKANNQKFDPNFIADFILNIIENNVIILNDKKTFMNQAILYGLKSHDIKLNYKECENCFYQRLKEIRNIINNIQLDHKDKLLKAAEEIEKEAKNKHYNSLIMDAMIALLGTNRSLTEKVESLNRIRNRLGFNCS